MSNGDVEVLVAVMFETIDVEFFAIDLDRDHLFDDEVDLAGVVEPYLRFNAPPGQSRPRSSQAFRDRIAVIDHPVRDTASVSGQSEHERLKIDFVERASSTRPVARRNRRLKALIQDDPLQRVEQTNRRRVSPLPDRPRIPVHHHPSGCHHVQSHMAIGARSQSSSVVVDGDVEWEVPQRPAPAGDEG
jgi:hypothetical protein